MASSWDSSPLSLALGSGTSLPLPPAPHVDTQVSLLHIVLPTPPTFTRCLSITTQFTRSTYNFTSHNYIAWTYSF